MLQLVLHLAQQDNSLQLRELVQTPISNVKLVQLQPFWIQMLQLVLHLAQQDNSLQLRELVQTPISNVKLVQVPQPFWIQMLLLVLQLAQKGRQPQFKAQARTRISSVKLALELTFLILILQHAFLQVLLVNYSVILNVSKHFFFQIIYKCNFFLILTEAVCHSKCASCLSYEICISCADQNAKPPSCSCSLLN